MSPLAFAPALALVVLGVGCEPKAMKLTDTIGGGTTTQSEGASTAGDTSTSGDTSTTSGSTSTGSGSDTSTTTASGSATTSDTTVGTTGTLECEQIKDAALCQQAATVDMPCAWTTFTSMSREGDLCTEHEAVSLCVTMSGNTSDAGCGEITPGCEGPGTPYYLEVDGQTLLYVRCGGSYVLGSTACPSGLATETEIPECACMCELAP